MNFTYMSQFHTFLMSLVHRHEQQHQQAFYLTFILVIIYNFALLYLIKNSGHREYVVSDQDQQQ